MPAASQPLRSPELSRSEIAGFYDQFSQKLVCGFVTGNPRIDHAIAFAGQHLPVAAETLLEVGCGVGETTARLCAVRPGLRAVGVDISPTNVRTAQQLFGESLGASFTVSDLSEPVPGGPFDVVTLFDVYEHIPRSERAIFHRHLRQAMSPRSRLILTCPSFLHQNHLRQHQPDGLQIVDETIGAAEILQLAHDLGGQLTHLHYESVWRTNDYVYATIDSEMDYRWKPKLRGWRRIAKKLQDAADKTPWFGGPARRERLVQRRLAS